MDKEEFINKYKNGELSGSAVTFELSKFNYNEIQEITDELSAIVQKRRDAPKQEGGYIQKDAIAAAEPIDVVAPNINVTVDGRDATDKELVDISRRVAKYIVDDLQRRDILRPTVIHEHHTTVQRAPPISWEPPQVNVESRPSTSKPRERKSVVKTQKEDLSMIEV